MLFKNIILLLLCFIGLITLCITSCKEDKKEIKQVEVSFKKEGELTLYKSTSDSIITTFNIEIADSDYDIQTGLMYRSSMKENQGMLFVFPNSTERYFYMKNTKFSIDIIYIDDKKNVVSFQQNAKPFDESSLPSYKPAQYVFEINAGLVAKYSIEVGDRIDYSSF